MDSPEAVARAAALHWSLGLGSGLVVACPVPAEFALPSAVVDRAISAALAAASRAGVSGAAVTPFLLDQIREQTVGESIATNIALIRNNATIAARIANALRAFAEPPATSA